MLALDGVTLPLKDQVHHLGEGAWKFPTRNKVFLVVAISLWNALLVEVHHALKPPDVQKEC